jgi:transposase, IS30 family
VAHSRLRAFIDTKLLDDQSPRAIAGRLKKKEKHLPQVSKDSICRYTKSVYGRKIEARRNKMKPSRRIKRPQAKKLRERTFIGKRPKIINTRERVGDTEADFILSGKTGKGILLVVVCRKLRLVCVEQICSVTIRAVHRAFKRIQKRFPEMKSITADNDLLLQKHKELEKILGIKIYFCDPYSSWQKGSVENANKHIRRYIPKGSDISRYSKYRIKKIEKKLNDRIMECLNFATPSELLAGHRYKKNALRRRQHQK